MKNFKLINSICILVFISVYDLNADKIPVVTTSPDLADLVRNVGGEKVDVVSLSRGNQDIHFIEPRPSMVMHLKKAKMVVKIGMDLDNWVDSLIQVSRNADIFYGAVGYVDASLGISRLEVPQGKVDASMGDIHIYGNPHYWLDPENVPVITRNIKDGLCRIAPEHSVYFIRNRDEYLSKIKTLTKIWVDKIKPYAGTNVVTYHNSWIYFVTRFGLKVIDFIEPKPGIPPSPSHINSLIKRIQEQQVKLILVEPYFSLKAANLLNQKTNVKVLVLPVSVGGVKGINTYLDMFEYIVSQISDSLKDSKQKGD